MGGLSSVIGHLVIDRVLSGRPPAPQKPERTQLILLSVAAFFVLLASIFGLIALFHVLRENYDADVAAAITALTSLLIGVLIAAYAYSKRTDAPHKAKLHKPQMPHMPHDIKGQIDGFLKSFEGDWEHPIREHPKTAVALAALVGYVLGDRA